MVLFWEYVNGNAFISVLSLLYSGYHYVERQLCCNLIYVYCLDNCPKLGQRVKFVKAQIVCAFLALNFFIT